MNQYKIRKEGYQQIRKAALWRSIPVIVLAAAAGIFISVTRTKTAENDISVLPVVIPLITLSIGIGIYRGLKRQQRLFESYILTVTENMITREQFNTPEMALYFDEITIIIKYKNGNLLLKAKNAIDQIAIPAQVENYEDLLQVLTTIRPFETTEKLSLRERYPAVIALGSVGLMMGVYIASNKIVVGVAATMDYGKKPGFHSKEQEYRPQKQTEYVVVSSCHGICAADYVL